MPDNSAIRPAASAAEPVTQSAFTHRLATPILKYLEGRGLLLGIEAREAMQHVVTVAAWVAIGAVAAFAGWLLLVTSLVGVLTHYLDGSWVKATAIAGAAHILVALTAGLVTRKRLTTARWFADSLDELKKDRAWLHTQTTKN
jgi:membrane protein